MAAGRPGWEGQRKADTAHAAAALRPEDLSAPLATVSTKSDTNNNNTEMITPTLVVVGHIVETAIQQRH